MSIKEENISDRNLYFLISFLRWNKNIGMGPIHKPHDNNKLIKN